MDIEEAPFIFCGCIGDLLCAREHTSAIDCAIISGFSFWRIFHPVVDQWSLQAAAAFARSHPVYANSLLQTTKHAYNKNIPEGFQLMRELVEVQVPEQLSRVLPTAIRASLVLGLPHHIFGDALIADSDEHVYRAGNAIAGRQVISRQSGTHFNVEGLHTLEGRFGPFGSAVPLQQLWLVESEDACMAAEIVSLAAEVTAAGMPCGLAPVAVAASSLASCSLPSPTPSSGSWIRELLDEEERRVSQGVSEGMQLEDKVMNWNTDTRRRSKGSHLAHSCSSIGNHYLQNSGGSSSRRQVGAARSTAEAHGQQV